MTSPFFSTQDFLNGKNNSNGWGISPELILKAYQQNPEQTNNAMRTIPIIRNDVREKLGLPPLHTPTVEVDAPFQKLPQNVLNVQTPTVAEENPTSNGLSQQPVNPLPTPQPQSSQENQFQTPTAPQTEKPTQEDVSTRVSLDTLNATQNQPSQPDSFELARLASGNINNNNLGYINEIIAAKNAWGNATTDADRKAAADYATYIRNLAQMNDVDLGQFGDASGLSGEQANLALGKYVLDEAEKAQNKFQAVQDNLKNNYGESSNDHFWRLYDEYRQQGYGDRKAAILAGRETQTYQQDRVSNLRDAINEYGIDNGNILNQFGVNTLAQIAEEDNIMGTAIANGFETPKENYEKQQAMLQEMLRQTSANQRKQAEILANQFITEYVQGQITDRTNSTNKVKQDIAQMKENRNDARTEYTEKNKFDLEKFKQENRVALKKADQEFTYNLEQAKAEWAKQGKGDFTKSADYKIATDNYERARQAYQDLLKDGANPTTEELANAKAAYEKAQRDIEDVVKQYQFSQVPEEMLEVPKGDYSAALRYIQKLKSQGIYTDEMLIELATDSGYTGREARAMLEGKERPHSRTTG